MEARLYWLYDHSATCINLEPKSEAEDNVSPGIEVKRA